jgi:hypothetical protein
VCRQNVSRPNGFQVEDAAPKILRSKAKENVLNKNVENDCFETKGEKFFKK